MKFNELPKKQGRFHFLCLAMIVAFVSLLFSERILAAPLNLLKNPGFEDATTNPGNAPGWQVRGDSGARAMVSDREAHTGHQSLYIPKSCAVEQSITKVAAGPYLARCWVKSEVDQRVTFILQDPARPWAAYTYSDITAPKEQWISIEVFCALDQDGELTLTVGSLPKEFRSYHGAESEMTSPILVDDVELFRCERSTPSVVGLWDSQMDLGDAFDWRLKSQWAAIQNSSHTFVGNPIFQDRNLTGTVRRENGELKIYSVTEQGVKLRGSITPSPAFKVSKCAVIKRDTETGIQVTSEDGHQSYIAWLKGSGLVKIEPKFVSRFVIGDCRLRHGILPSFVGADICYSAAKLTGPNKVNIPSTQWFVGLVDGNDSLMVAVWDSDAQATSMGLSGSGADRVIDSISIDTSQGGFALSFIQYPGIWHQERLQEDWLGEYVPIAWKRPFEARWMAHFFVTPGGKPSFQEPYMDYSFPIASTKTRMWGVWFEDWNRYPFFFDGPRTMCHFEKTFSPNGDALIYFLEPAGTDLASPTEIVALALGEERAASLFDLNANKIRKLTYSTPDEFMYDRPVCATTTRLSQIKKNEKPTVGVNLATHLYEFIREIRGRVDQYSAFFGGMRNNLKTQKATHPEMESYVNELEAMVIEAQAKAKTVYATPLTAVQSKTDSMKQLLREGGGDGFDCGSLDVRGPAGAQDDLCRRYNRQVLRLMQTAAAKCGDSPEKAALAKDIWIQSRLVLREPTRWEPRRTLYFFEP